MTPAQRSLRSRLGGLTTAARHNPREYTRRREPRGRHRTTPNAAYAGRSRPSPLISPSPNRRDADRPGCPRTTPGWPIRPSDRAAAKRRSLPMTWVRIPDTWWRDDAALALCPAARDLFVRLLSYCALTRSDGRLSRSAVSAATDDLDVSLLIAELVGNGFMAADERGWSVIEPDAYLFTEAMRQRKVSAGRLGGQTRAEKGYRPTRGPDGRITGTVAFGTDEAVSAGTADAVSIPSLPEVGKGTHPVPPDVSGWARVGDVNENLPPAPRKQLLEGRSWDAAFGPFLKAWAKRGFRLPPTEKQRELIWPVVDARPNDAAIWVASAPRGSSAHDVVGYVLRHWRSLREDVA
jgi:hypothetical protein